MTIPTSSANCMACGKPLPFWFTDETAEAEDDAAYERWLDEPCPHCGATPRQFLPKRPTTIH